MVMRMLHPVSGARDAENGIRRRLFIQMVLENEPSFLGGLTDLPLVRNNFAECAGLVAVAIHERRKVFMNP